jgi:hypothetical protein
MRIRLWTIAGRAPVLLVRVARSVVFWVAVLPTSLGLYEIRDALPISTREKFIVSMAMALSVACLPALSGVLSGGRRSVHDILCGTIVLPLTEPCERKDQEVTARRFSVRFLIWNGALLASFFLLFASLLDWRYRISDTLVPYFEQRAAYLTEAYRSVASDPSGIVDVVDQQGPSDVYFNADATAFLPGPVETFRFPVSPHAFASPNALIRIAFDRALAIRPSLQPNTRLIALDLYWVRAFGPAAYERHQSLILEAPTYKLRYAPARQEFIYGGKRLSLAERLSREDMPDSVITYFEPKVSGRVTIRSYPWRFPSLDLSERVSGPSSRFVGRAF